MSIYRYNEFYDFRNQDLTINDRQNVASLSQNGTGIENLILWIGCKINNHPVVKVSNKPWDLTGTDLFSIRCDNLDIIGEPNKSFITDEVIDKIKLFIEKNKQHIISYTNEELFTDEMIDRLIPCE